MGDRAMMTSTRSWKPALRALAALWLVLLASCDDTEPGAVEPIPWTPTMAPNSVEPLTDIPVEALVLAGDAAGLAPLLLLHEAPCEPNASPRCREDQEAGELVKVFSGDQCDGGMQLAEDVEGLLTRRLNPLPVALYAAYRDSRGEAVADDYVFSISDGGALQVSVAAAGIVSIHHACGNSPEVIVGGWIELAMGEVQWIVPPPE